MQEYEEMVLESTCRFGLSRFTLNQPTSSTQKYSINIMMYYVYEIKENLMVYKTNEDLHHISSKAYAHVFLKIHIHATSLKFSITKEYRITNCFTIGLSSNLKMLKNQCQHLQNYDGVHALKTFNYLHNITP